MRLEHEVVLARAYSSSVTVYSDVLYRDVDTIAGPIGFHHEYQGRLP